MEIWVHKVSLLPYSLVCLYFDARQRRMSSSISWSQHKCVEWPNRPMFPDYLSVSYDYALTKDNCKHITFPNNLDKIVFLTEPTNNTEVNSKINTKALDRN